MPIDFDPVFHTETMVKILREQGSTQYAMELAELILQKNPQHEGVRLLLEELREEARRAFERFKSGGRTPEAPAAASPEEGEVAVEAEAAEPEAESKADEKTLDLQETSPPAADFQEPGAAAPLRADERDEVGSEMLGEEREGGAESPATASESEPVRLTLVPPPPPPTRREAKILRLQSLLRRVQSLRKAAHAPQA